MLGSALPLAAVALKLKAVRNVMRGADSILQDVLFGEAGDPLMADSGSGRGS